MLGVSRFESAAKRWPFGGSRAAVTAFKGSGEGSGQPHPSHLPHQFADPAKPSERTHAGSLNLSARTPPEQLYGPHHRRPREDPDLAPGPHRRCPGPRRRAPAPQRPGHHPPRRPGDLARQGKPRRPHHPATRRPRRGRALSVGANGRSGTGTPASTRAGSGRPCRSRARPSSCGCNSDGAATERR